MQMRFYSKLSYFSHRNSFTQKLIFPFSEFAPETPTGMGLDYIGIIATNNFFIQLLGVNNLVAKDCEVRMYGVRARADASIYAALVQSEVLSA